MSMTGIVKRNEVPGAEPRVRSVATTRRHHSIGFWIAAAAFLLNMGFSAVPTPLYVLYQQRDHFSTIMVTVVYAVYAVGVVGSLFLAGHLSDSVGRKRVFVPALLINVVSALVFLLAPSLAGLLIARIISGISVGLTTATATAYLTELHSVAAGPAAARTGRRAQVVAIATNLGGIGFGPLVAGLLAQYAPQPLRLSYLVFAIALVILAGAVALSPETTQRSDPLPPWRPQRVAVPAGARRLFFAATAAGLASFAVFGTFTSLVPSLLAGTLHQSSHAVAGAIVFSAFAAGALAQILLGRVSTDSTLRISPLLLLPGLALLVTAMWRPNLTLFIAAGVITGAGAGLLFRAALIAAASTASPDSRAEVLAGYFLGAYVGLSVPVVALGVATEYAPVRDVIGVFAVIVAAAVLAAVRAIRAQAPVSPAK
jgi:predicted MFS family arabinose efflux permease